MGLANNDTFSNCLYLNLHCLFLCVTSVGIHVTAYVRRSEDYFVESVLILHPYVDSSGTNALPKHEPSQVPGLQHTPPCLLPGCAEYYHIIPGSPRAHHQHCSFSQGCFDLLPIVLSTTSFFQVSPLLSSFFLVFSSHPQASLCGQGCFHHCRKHPLSPGGFSELSFCFDPQIVFGGTARDHRQECETMGVR